MKTRTLFAVFVLFCAAPALAAEFVVVAPAYEVPLAHLRAPATPNGGITFKECDDCVSRSIRVTDNTLYVLNGRPTTLAKFKDAIATVSDRNSVTVTVVHHLESNVVTKVKATLHKDK